MRRTKTINEIFAPRVWRLGGASVRRAAMTLMLVMLTTMTAWAETETVSYIDANGQTQTVTATVIEAGTTYYPGGTYVIKDDVNFTSKVTFNGNTTIICVDEKTMQVTIDDSETDKGIHVRGNLTLYGQGGESPGSIMVERGNDASEFIGLKVQNNLTVYGGIAAFIHQGNNGGSGIDAADVAIYGGESSETTEIISTTDFTDYTDYAGAWYTLDGRKLDTKPTRKGVYIVNGKKVIIK